MENQVGATVIGRRISVNQDHPISTIIVNKPCSGIDGQACTGDNQQIRIPHQFNSVFQSPLIQ
jgi:hypothetical protein